ncbi:MAG: sulfite exporter TauE/SafE family protein, partial [Aquificota bacterium]
MTVFFVTFFAWVFQAVSGFGAGIFIIGFLSLFYEPKTVIVSSALFNLAGTLGLLYQNRKGKVNLYFLFSLVAGSLPGIYTGAYLLDKIDSHTLRVVIGLFIASLGLYDFLVQKGLLSFRLNRHMGLPMGFLGGLFAGLVGMGGPPPVVFLNQQLKDSCSIRLTLNLFFTSNILLRLLFYQNFQVVRLDIHFVAQGLAGALFGVLVGGFVAKSLRAHAYKKLVPLSVFVL